jgi:hypothetical protein
VLIRGRTGDFPVLIRGITVLIRGIAVLIRGRTGDFPVLIRGITVLIRGITVLIRGRTGEIPVLIRGITVLIRGITVLIRGRTGDFPRSIYHPDAPPNEPIPPVLAGIGSSLPKFSVPGLEAPTKGVGFC